MRLNQRRSHATRYLTRACAAQWDAEQARLRQQANEKRSQAAKARPRNDDGTLASGTTSSGTTRKRDGHQKGELAKAAAAGTNRAGRRSNEKAARRRAA